MEIIKIKTAGRSELVDIADRIRSVVAKSKVTDGVCFVFVPHTTAGLIINENADPSVGSDMLNSLARLAPANAGYLHTEGNSDAHVKSSIVGQSLTLFIENGNIELGTWQGIFFLEGDGPRSREVWVKIIK
jgi:secondary thiamine-phosphate synthase enzyme